MNPPGFKLTPALQDLASSPRVPSTSPWCGLSNAGSVESHMQARVPQPRTPENRLSFSSLKMAKLIPRPEP